MTKEKRKVRKAVFPAAGLGTRFLPATKAQPKEMLPVVDKPIIQYAVEEAMQSGVETMIIVTGRGKTAIEDHFDVSFELEQLLKDRGKTAMLQQVRALSDMVQVAYVRQKEALGLGHAIFTTRHLIENEPFAVLLSDDLMESERPCIGQLIDVFDFYQHSVVAIQRVPREETSRYGIIRAERIPDDRFPGELYRIMDMVEKPAVEDAPSDLAILGRYVLTPEIFEKIGQTRPGTIGEIQITDAMRALLAEQPIYGYAFQGKRHDAGEKLGSLKATIEIGLNHPEVGRAFREYLKAQQF
jgi:UTP--glucose-1-phosphate uridylyltransferase